MLAAAAKTTLFTSACKPSTVFNTPNCELTFEIAGVAVAPDV
jgi:hypothetical protein